MGTGNILGLLFEISADPSKAQEAIANFERTTGNVLTRVAQAPKPFNDELLSSRESVRLLSEEFGLHLPRAVTGAIAQMVPAVAGFGGVLLGAFAIQEIPKMVAGIEEAVQSWEGFGKAERAAMEKAIQDTATLYAKVLNVEHELDLLGKNRAEQAELHAKWAEEDADRALKPLLAAEAKVQDIQAKIAEAKRGAGAFAAGAGSAYEGALKVAQAEVGKLHEAWKLADEGALLAQRRAAEAAKQLTKQEAADQERAAKQYAETWERGTEQVRDYWQKRLKADADGAAKELAAQRQLVVQREKLLADETQWRFRQSIEQIRIEQRQTSEEEKEAQKRMQNAVRFLFEKAGAARQATALANAQADAEQRASEAFREQMVAAGAQLTASIGFRRIAAGIEAVWETAEGIGDLAIQNYRGAALHFMSAAEYGIIAGTSAHHGGYGGYGGGGGRAGAMPGDLVRGRPVLGSGSQGESRGQIASGGGTTLQVHVYGNVYGGPAGIDQLAAEISDAVDRRDVHLSATRVKDSTLSRDSFNG